MRLRQPQGIAKNNTSSNVIMGKAFMCLAEDETSGTVTEEEA